MKNLQYWTKQKIEGKRWVNTRYLKEGMVWTDKPAQAAAESLKYCLKNGKIVLVPGCGYGRNCFFFASKGFKVVGIDNSETGIDLAKRLATKEEVYIVFLKENILNLPFANNTFDIVFFHKGLHQFSRPDRKKVIKEIHRTLVPSGILFLTTFSVKDPAYGRGKLIEPNTYDDRGFRPVHFFNINEMEKLVNPYFATIKIEDKTEIETHREKGKTWKDHHKIIFYVGKVKKEEQCYLKNLKEMLLRISLIIKNCWMRLSKHPK